MSNHDTFTPETVKLLTEEEINKHSKAEWQKLYEQVEALLKRFHPLAWSQFVALKFRECKGDFRRFATCPPHFMLRSIEANAAYWRRQNDDEVSQNKFNKVMNAFISHADPLLMSFAAKDIIHMGLLMHRDQIEIQTQHSTSEIARLWLLFVKDNPIPKLTKVFEERFSITPAQWLQLSYVTFCSITEDAASRTSVANIAEYAKGILQTDTIDWFVKRSSWTPTKLGENYRAIRRKIAPQFHSFIRSAFLEAPIIDFGDGRWLAPHPPLIFRNMGAGLYRLFREIWEDDKSEAPTLRSEFADAAEAHVGRVLDCCVKEHTLLREQDLQTLSSGRKTCDFLLETLDAIILVESKGVSFDRDLLLPKYMQEDISTTRIIEAGEQLWETYSAVVDGKFNSILNNPKKAVIGIICTYGEIPYANSDWYFDKVIAPRAQARNMPIRSSSFGLPSRPIVMSHETLEIFITAVNTLDRTPSEILEIQRRDRLVMTGDWSNFLRHLLVGVAIKPLSYIECAAEQFFHSLGVRE